MVNVIMLLRIITVLADGLIKNDVTAASTSLIKLVQAANRQHTELTGKPIDTTRITRHDLID